MHSRTLLASIALVSAAAALPACVAGAGSSDTDVDIDGDEAEVASVSLALDPCPEDATFTFSRDDARNRTLASIGATNVAVFTDDAFTVSYTGASRTWTSGSAVTVTHTTWVRTLPRPFAATGPDAFSNAELTEWLNAARAVSCGDSPEADILDMASEYDEGSPRIPATGPLVSSDAGYVLGADFHDYLGISWAPPDGSNRPADPSQAGMLDCSGYVRLLFGHRNNFPSADYDAALPLSLKARSGHIPRESHDIFQSGPGRKIIEFRTGGQPSAAELADLRIGDLVFFDGQNRTSGATWQYITHLGIYVGEDTNGRSRFLSSRDSLSGPTMANSSSGWSIFASPGTSPSTYYLNRFRAARRF